LAYRYKTSGSYNVQKAAKVGSTAFRWTTFRRTPVCRTPVRRTLVRRMTFHRTFTTSNSSSSNLTGPWFRPLGLNVVKVRCWKSSKMCHSTNWSSTKCLFSKVRWSGVWRTGVRRNVVRRTAVEPVFKHRKYCSIVEERFTKQQKIFYTHQATCAVVNFYSRS
jgi:hypothetical protein